MLVAEEIKKYPKCTNPFFDCKNIEPELKIVTDIIVKGEQYSLCKKCWEIIAISDDYQWSTQNPQTTDNKPLEADWKHTEATAEEAE